MFEIQKYKERISGQSIKNNKFYVQELPRELPGPKAMGPGSSTDGSMPTYRAQKSLDFQDPTPYHLPLVMDLHASKTLRTRGAVGINHRC
jgi:hypothetical protein